MATAAAGIGLLAACSGSTSTTPTQAASGSTMAATVSTRSISGIPSKALVDSHGRALYLFEADKHGKSTCSGPCAAAWPPFTTTGTPQAGGGVRQSLLGTIGRADGATQVTYNGHPLYFFGGDSIAGTAKGQGSNAFGGGWYVMNASGNKIDTD
jgi:predicted lipoprotein with Yx(FWY)xxD motif